jgi:Flp pilus assembly protein TadG
VHHIADNHVVVAVIRSAGVAVGHRPRERRAPVRGQGLVEFALVLPILVLMLMGIFDLGRAIYAFNTIADAARTGSRVAIVDQNLSTDCTVVPATAKCAAADQAVALGINADSVVLTFRAHDLDGPCDPVLINCIAEVTVPYAFVAATPIIGNLVGTLTMTSTTRLPVERVYSTAP